MLNVLNGENKEQMPLLGDFSEDSEVWARPLKFFVMEGNIQQAELYFCFDEFLVSPFSYLYFILCEGSSITSLCFKQFQILHPKAFYLIE
jgi:hypothetical protein